MRKGKTGTQSVNSQLIDSERTEMIQLAKFLKRLFLGFKENMNRKWMCKQTVLCQ